MMMLWDEERYERNERRIKALMERTGKPHLSLWALPMGPDCHRPAPAEWMFDEERDFDDYDRLMDWCDRMDELRDEG